MKLRNKKTGEIGDLIGSGRSCPYITIRIDFHNGNPRSFSYTSLDQLNEEWEDYKPTELLIKDEKVRKAVRAWAEANNLKYIQYRSEDLGDRFNGYDYEYIQFNPWKADNLEDYKTYTIAELCGEEEE